MRITSPQFRFTVRVHRFLILVLFAAGLAMVPFRTVAQQSSSAPATQSAPAAPQGASGLPAQPGHEKTEQKEDENVFRHTALVQKMADIFHLDVETTARLFEFINFGILFLAVVIPLGRFLPKVIRKRSTTLSHNLEAARKTTADANVRLSAVEAQLSHLDEEIARIRAQVEEESKQDEVRIKATIEEERTRIVASAEQEIGVAAAQARRGLRHFAADLAIEQAARQLILAPEVDRALIAEFVGEAQDGADGARKGGQN